MHKPNVNEFQIKEERIQAFMKAQGYDAIVIATQPNFAWISGGGNSRIVSEINMGEAVLVFTATKKICVALSMDAPRIAAHELNGLGFEIVTIKWYEGSRDEYVTDFIKGLKALSDYPLEGAICNPSEFYKLHFPLTKYEIERYRVLGREVEEILWDISQNIWPGMTGNEVKTLLICEYAKKEMTVPVIIIGIDEEISSWRHPLPHDKSIKETIMIVLIVTRGGLNVPITRMMQFGEVPEEMRKKFNDICTIAADTILSCKAGVKFADVSRRQKKLYEKLGYPEEWEKHFVGGVTGYVFSDGSLWNDEDAVMTDGMTFNWYTTITGVNLEDTMITTKDGFEYFTVNGIWPVIKVTTEKGTIEIPDILVVKS